MTESVNCRIELPKVQECDATDDDSSTAAGNQKLLQPITYI
jgi:hypothetical protein